jgi:TldD protein
MTTRRDFVATTALAAGALALGRPRDAAAHSRLVPHVQDRMDAPTRDLLLLAIDSCKRAGASYADARIQRVQRNSIFTRERQILDIVDSDTMGCGIRALVDGCWGFAATPRLTPEGIQRAANEAVATAKANRIARDKSVELAPNPAHPDATWSSGFTIDPFSISIEEKTTLALAVNAAAMTVPGVRFVSTQFNFLKEERNYANTDGSVIAQTCVRTYTPIAITAVSADRSDFAIRESVVQPTGRGWESVLENDLVVNAKKWAEEAAEKLKAKSVEPGRYDLILAPSNLGLTLHESVGHPTELDRAYGYEANLAGTSFVAPPEKVLGSLKFGSPLMNIFGDRSQPGGCATIGYDDDGVKPEEFDIIKDGIFVDYQTTREQATWLDWWYKKRGMATRSHGCSYADSWSSVAFQRMPNVSIRPGTKDLGWNDLIAATDRGIAIMGRGSYSIDQQRYNGQFGGALFLEVRGGKVVGQLRDVAYQFRTPDFWGAMDMLGGQKSYELYATFSDGKGQPGQANAVTHGCVPTRHKQINVINTGRKA